MRNIRESTIEAYLVKRVRATGGETYKFTSPGRRGVPDRICIWDGEVVFVELKQAKRYLKPHQAREIKRLRRHGAQVWVVKSKTEVDAFVTVVTCNAKFLRPVLGPL